MSASSPRRKTAPRSKGAAARTSSHAAASSSSAVEEWVASVLEEKPVRYIIQNLERTYGLPVNKWTGWDVLDMLVSVILSQATSDTNSDRTYDALKERFPTWDAVLRAREQTLADTIRLGGLLAPSYEPPRPRRKILLLPRQPHTPRTHTLPPTRPTVRALPHRGILRLRAGDYLMSA